MNHVDLEALKRAIVERQAQPDEPSRRAERTERAQRVRAAEAQAHTLVAERTGIVRPEIGADGRTRRRDAISVAHVRDAPTASAAAARATFDAETARLQQLTPYAGRAIPLFDPTVTILSEPFFITQTPNNGLYTQSESVAPFDTRIRTLIEGNVSTSTTYTLWFLWSNESDSFAIVSAYASLTFNGTLTAECNQSGFFGDKQLDLGITTLLNLEKNDGTTLSSAQQNIASMQLQGGLFSDAHEDRWLEYQHWNVFVPACIVPPQTPVLIAAPVVLGYNFTNHEFPDDGDPGNDAIIDFADERSGYFLGCSGVTVSSSPLRLL